MRWIMAGGRGYVPHCTSNTEGEFSITYDEHGYADDISITTGSLENLKAQLKKLHLFSKHTGLELEITKCEVTGALWDRGNPTSKENLRILRNQIASIDLTGEPDGPTLKFLPPDKSYKMLGVHINPLLNFSEHFQHITGEVRKLAKVLQRKRLSPTRKQLVIDQLLQAKYHAVHLGVFTDPQMDQIDSLLASATRNAHQLTPGFPTEGLRRNTDQYGLGCLPIRTRAAKRGLAHLVDTINTPSDRGAIAFEHVKRLTTLYHHWPEESFDTGQACLPTLRLLRYIQTIPGLELANLAPLALTNPIADTLREASAAVDYSRRQARDLLPTQALTPAEYHIHRRKTLPLKASSRIIKHLSPLWSLGLHEWSQILTRSSEDNALCMPPAQAILAKVLGNSKPQASTLAPANKALRTLRHILSHPACTEYPKLPPQTIDRTLPSSTKIHPSWLPLLPSREVPVYRPGLRSATAQPRNKTLPSHHFDTYLRPSDAIDTPYDVLEISDHRTLHQRTMYLVSKWAPETLTQSQIDTQKAEGFRPKSIVSTPPAPEWLSQEPTFTVTWSPAWQRQDTIMDSPTGPAALQAYKDKAFPRSKKRRKLPPPGARRRMGWFPKHATFQITPIHPDLDSLPGASIKFRTHPTLPDTVLVHDTDGKAKGSISKARLDKLYAAHTPTSPTDDFHSTILQQLLTQGRTAKAISEIPLRKSDDSSSPPKEDPARHTWTIPDALYAALHSIFSFDRVLHCTPFNLPLSATCHMYSEDPLATTFSMLPQSNQIWPGSSLSIPLQTPQSLRSALERAIYSAHHQRHHNASSTVLLLPSWTHTPYLASHLQNSPYVHKIMTTPAICTGDTSISSGPTPTTNRKMHIYLVANNKALLPLDTPTATRTLREAAHTLYGTHLPITLPSHGEDGTAIQCSQKYTLEDNEPPLPSPPPKPPLTIFPHVPIWDNLDFVYTDGSLIAGLPTLGAAVVFPEDRTIKIEVKSSPIRHTINRAELVAITVALREAHDMPSIRILTDSAFCIHCIRNHISSPASYTDHLHRSLLEAADALIKTRDDRGFRTHIGKVKSHTGVKYNDEADEGAKQIATLEEEANVEFSEYDPPAGGLRTWPYIRTPNEREGEPDRITHFTNLKQEPNQRYTQATYAAVRSTTLYGDLLSKSRSHGADHSIHAYSTSSFRQRRDAMEVAWGAHKYRLMTKAHKHRFPTCAKCGQKLTHSHLLGGCRTTSKLKISRHHSTFKLLHQLLDQENGGRWPILAMDLGRQATRDFVQQLEDCRVEIITLPTPPAETHDPPTEDPDEDKPDSHYHTVLPEYLLPTANRPTHYKPDIIRAVGYLTDHTTGQLTPDLTYTGRRVLQIIECKFATDTDMHETTTKIKRLYNPLRQAIMDHGQWQGDIDIIPIVISRTGSFNTKTLAEIAQLISFTEEPPEEMTYRQMPPAAKRIAMALHTHAQQWLTLMLKISKQTLAPRHR